MHPKTDRKKRLSSQSAIQQKVVYTSTSEELSDRSTHPNRTTKVSQKLALFPDEGDEAFSTESLSEGEEFYSQISQTPKNTQHTKRMIQLKRKDLPRVTAYGTAKMDLLLKYLQNRRHSIINNAPKRIDECLYSSISLEFECPSTIVQISCLEPGENTLSPETRTFAQFLESEETLKVGELFFFDYGVIVMWGFTELQEKSLLMELSTFEQERLDETDIKVEELNFHYDPSCQPW
ncbi:sporulation protein rmd1 [Basidiobolus ranarum]|uniref:Sporulation protein rmd1 n=1 Tax=Basidiobolus ranarum TaxID=34480 RepID=A0ABR2W5R0_9FUNG